MKKLENKFFLTIPAAAILAVTLYLATFAIPTFAQSDAINQTGESMQKGANQTGEAIQGNASQAGENLTEGAKQLASNITEGAKDVVGSIGKGLEELGK